MPDTEVVREGLQNVSMTGRSEQVGEGGRLDGKSHGERASGGSRRNAA